MEPGEAIEALAAHDAEHVPAAGSTPPGAGRAATPGARPVDPTARPAATGTPPGSSTPSTPSTPSATPPKAAPSPATPPTPPPATPSKAAPSPATPPTPPPAPPATPPKAAPSPATPPTPPTPPPAPPASGPRTRAAGVPAAPAGPTRKPTDRHVLERVASGSFHDPHSVLGAHIHQGALTVRSLRPFAASVAVVLPDGERVPMEHECDGIWATVLPTPQVPDYRLAVTYEGVGETVVDEPYRYLPTLGEIDLHLIREGRHEQLWDVLGAHVRRYPARVPSTPSVRSRAPASPSGPQRPGRAGRRRLQPLGRPRARRCAASAPPASGRSSSRASGRRPLQVRDPRPRRALAAEGRPAGVRHRGAAVDGERRHRVHLRVAGRRVADPAGGDRPAQRADERLRGAPRVVAAGTVLPRARRRARRATWWTLGFTHVEFLPAGRAPVRRLLGLPGHVVLRADVPIRHPGRLPLPRRPRSTRPASA